jgi:hypothetical protein
MVVRRGMRLLYELQDADGGKMAKGIKVRILQKLFKKLNSDDILVPNRITGNLSVLSGKYGPKGYIDIQEDELELL